MTLGNGLTAGSFFAARQGATRNILNPLLVLCAIVTPVCLAAMHFATNPISTALFVAALVPPFCALAAYAYWTFKDPNRLQSEEFVLQQRWLDTQPQIGDNRTNEVVEISSQVSTVLTANTSPEGQ